MSFRAKKCTHTCLIFKASFCESFRIFGCSRNNPYLDRATPSPLLPLSQVLKIAILAEKYASDLRWYVDVILQLISHAGDFVYDEIW